MIKEMRDIMAGAGVACFTDHPDFDTVCFNATILQITAATFDRPEKRTYIRGLPEHKRHRYLSYCNVARWVYGRTGVGNREPLSACVVDKIRNGHPPPEVSDGEDTTLTYRLFTGFRYADEEEQPVDDEDPLDAQS